MNDNHYSIRLPERGTISEVIVHSGYPEGRRVIKLDPPLRVEPGAMVMLSLALAVAMRTVIEETDLRKGKPDVKDTSTEIRRSGAKSDVAHRIPDSDDDLRAAERVDAPCVYDGETAGDHQGP